jgi:two-component system, response regulator
MSIQENSYLLLVEDNADEEMLAVRALKKSSSIKTIQVARDGEEALQFLTQNIDHLPHLVLLDLKIPKLNGLDVLKEIRANPRMRKLPVIMLTSSNERSDIENSYELGVNSYVRKPVNQSILASNQ